MHREVHSPPQPETLVQTEARLLQDPAANAGELYSHYGRQLVELAKSEPFEVETFFTICDRQKVVSKLLPTSDERSYETWKRNNLSGQQG